MLLMLAALGCVPASDVVVDDTAPTGCNALEWYLDADMDGFGAGDPVCAESNPGEGFTAIDGDCDDTDDAINPNAEETCDPADTDCDGEPYLGAVDAISGFEDGDGDGYGAGPELQTCTEGLVANDGDCDDTDASISPDGQEVLGDGIDNDCDGADLTYDDLDWCAEAFPSTAPQGSPAACVTDEVFDGDIIFATTEGGSLFYDRNVYQETNCPDDPGDNFMPERVYRYEQDAGMTCVVSLESCVPLRLRVLELVAFQSCPTANREFVTCSLDEATQAGDDQQVTITTTVAPYAYDIVIDGTNNWGNFRLEVDCQ